MEIVKLKPAIKDYIWGGQKLKNYGKTASSDIIAETWELSFRPDAPTLIASGPHDGEPLYQIASKEDIGSNPASFPYFPVLIKLIDSASNLSVQVHPGDDYALAHEHSYGKTEMWHVVEAEPGCGLYVGFKREVSKEEVRKAMKDGTILDLLNFFEVKPGESYFIPSGTVHAIGKGITVIEIQQNSDLTYRLYDYNRLGKDGKPRELHIEKGLDVIDFKPYKKKEFAAPIIGKTDYFTSYRHELNGKIIIQAKPDSYASLTILEGEGVFDGITFQKGDSFFVPASRSGVIEGKAVYILTETSLM